MCRQTLPLFEHHYHELHFLLFSSTDDASGALQVITSSIVGDRGAAIASNLLSVQGIGKFSKSPLFVKVDTLRECLAHRDHHGNPVFRIGDFLGHLKFQQASDGSGVRSKYECRYPFNPILRTKS
jgi:hypothetical protein